MIRIKSLFAVFILLLFSLPAISQKTTWASEVEEYSSERQKLQYSALQVLGEPNVYPNMIESPVSWSPAKPANKKGEFIKVSFKDRFYVKQIVVAQNFNPGAIKEIYLFNTNDRGFLVYENSNSNVSKTAGLFNYILPEVTKYKVRAIKLVLDTKSTAGYNCIDAIGVSESEEPVTIDVQVGDSFQLLSEPENLGANVNSNSNDYIPQISPDGKELYFARKENNQVNIWRSTLSEQNVWSSAEKLGSPLNNEHDNFVYTITPDGNTLLLGNSYGGVGSNIGATTSLKNGNSWSEPEKEKIDALFSESQYNEFFLGPNKKVMLMTLQNQSSLGETDIFVSFLKPDKSWSEPKNLGSTVNTADIEASPFLAADNRTLYFASRGHRGYGKTDIFVTKRTGEGWDKWTEPINLGPVINSKEAEYYYSVPASGEYAYYVSKNNTLGGSDIFRVKLPKAIKPKPVTLVYGTVYNAKTKRPISADILYELLPEGIEAGIASSNKTNGEYKIVLPIDEVYGFYASLKGYIPVSDRLDLKNTEEEYTEIRRDLYLVPLDKGQKLVLNNVLFDQSESELLPASIPELDRLNQVLNENPRMVIKLIGHTDNRGSRELNQSLSEERVKVVKEYLVRKGIQAKRIFTKGKGGTEPINDNSTEEKRRLNRRVELEIVYNPIEVQY